MPSTILSRGLSATVCLIVTTGWLMYFLSSLRETHVFLLGLFAGGWIVLSAGTFFLGIRGGGTLCLVNPWSRKP